MSGCDVKLKGQAWHAATSRRSSQLGPAHVRARTAANPPRGTLGLAPRLRLTNLLQHGGPSHFNELTLVLPSYHPVPSHSRAARWILSSSSSLVYLCRLLPATTSLSIRSGTTLCLRAEPFVLTRTIRPSQSWIESSPLVPSAAMSSAPRASAGETAPRRAARAATSSACSLFTRTMAAAKSTAPSWAWACSPGGAGTHSSAVVGGAMPSAMRRRRCASCSEIEDRGVGVPSALSTP